MNRRDFIGAAIGALVAALLLPFEDFAAWCRRWLRPSNRVFRVGPGNYVVQFSRVLPLDFEPYAEWIGQRAVSSPPTVTGRIGKVDRLRGAITVSA